MRYCNEASFLQQGTIWLNDLSVLLQSNSLTQSIDIAPELPPGLRYANHLIFFEQFSAILAGYSRSITRPLRSNSRTSSVQTL